MRLRRDRIEVVSEEQWPAFKTAVYSGRGVAADNFCRLAVEAYGKLCKFDGCLYGGGQANPTL